jgi:hypothetical protein
MTSEGLGEMFEGDSADTCARKFRRWGSSLTVQLALTSSQVRENKLGLNLVIYDLHFNLF